MCVHRIVLMSFFAVLMLVGAEEIFTSEAMEAHIRHFVAQRGVTCQNKHQLIEEDKRVLNSAEFLYDIATIYDNNEYRFPGSVLLRNRGLNFLLSLTIGKAESVVARECKGRDVLSVEHGTLTHCDDDSATVGVFLLSAVSGIECASAHKKYAITQIDGFVPEHLLPADVCNVIIYSERFGEGADMFCAIRSIVDSARTRHSPPPKIFIAVAHLESSLMVRGICEHEKDGRRVGLGKVSFCGKTVSRIKFCGSAALFSAFYKDHPEKVHKFFSEATSPSQRKKELMEDKLLEAYVHERYMRFVCPEIIFAIQDKDIPGGAGRVYAPWALINPRPAVDCAQMIMDRPNVRKWIVPMWLIEKDKKLFYAPRDYLYVLAYKYSDARKCFSVPLIPLELQEGLWVPVKGSLANCASVEQWPKGAIIGIILTDPQNASLQYRNIAVSVRAHLQEEMVSLGYVPWFGTLRGAVCEMERRDWIEAQCFELPQKDSSYQFEPGTFEGRRSFTKFLSDYFSSGDR